MCLAALSSFIICPVDTAAVASAASVAVDVVSCAIASVDATSSLLIIFLIALIHPLGSVNCWRRAVPVPILSAVVSLTLVVAP